MLRYITPFNGPVKVTVESMIIGIIVFSHGVTSYLFNILKSINFITNNAKRIPAKRIIIYNLLYLQ